MIKIPLTEENLQNDYMSFKCPLYMACKPLLEGLLQVNGFEVVTEDKTYKIGNSYLNDKIIDFPTSYRRDGVAIFGIASVDKMQKAIESGNFISAHVEIHEI